MPDIKLSTPEYGQSDKETMQNLMDVMFRYRKELNFLLQNLDSVNVRDINTNITRVASEKGETIVDGALLLMTDNAGTQRASLGLDTSTDSFIFQLNNADGNTTIGLNDLGNAIFTGEIGILSDAGEYTTLNGSLLTMGDGTNNRIKLGYDSEQTKFIFEMYDGDGLKTLSFNDTGQAVFSGSIDTKKDVKIGESLRMRSVDAQTGRGIYFGETDDNWIQEYNGEMVLHAGDILTLQGSNHLNVHSKTHTSLRSDDFLTVGGGQVNISGGNDRYVQIASYGTGDIFLTTDNGGAYYNGNEIATTDQIPDPIDTSNLVTYEYLDWNHYTQTEIDSKLNLYATENYVDQAILDHVNAWHY